MASLNRRAVLMATFLAFASQAAAQQRSSQQQQLRANAPGGGVAAGIVLPAWPSPRNPLDSITPVSDAMLRNPQASDWLT